MRSHYCGLIDESIIGQRVTLCGWADVSRNLGGVCFIDLRDHEGIVQVVAETETPAFADASDVGYEDCLSITGPVRAWHSATERLRSGKVEVLAEPIELLTMSNKRTFYSNPTHGMDDPRKYTKLNL